MTLIQILILSFALSLDALLVSFSYGLVINSKKIKNALLLSVFFGLFQFIMPLIGGYISSFVYSFLELFSKWIVFSIFLILGLKFLKGAFSKEDEIEIKCISIYCIFILAIATSIDAMGAGVSLCFVNADIFKTSIIIGLITFINSFAGFYAAVFCKKIPSKYIEITGAIMLFYLAIKAII